MGEPTQPNSSYQHILILEDGKIKGSWNQDRRDRLSRGEIEGAFAGPDQSFPIAGPADVGDAWGLAGKADNPDKIRRRIIAIARKYGWLSGLPASAKEWAAERGISLGKSLGTILEHVGYKGANDRWLVVKNHIVLFGDKDKKDLVGEWFDGETDLESDYTKAIGRLPVDFEHGLRIDGPASPGRDDVLGYTDWETAQKTDNGWLVRSMLDRRNKYVQTFEPLILERMIGTSSEAVVEGIEVEDDGHIRRWPLKRNSLTVEPAEPGMLSGNALSAYKSLQSLLNPDDPDQETEGETVTAEGEPGPGKTNISNLREPKKMEQEKEKTTPEVVTVERFQTLEGQIKSLNDQVTELLGIITTTPAAKGKVVAPDSETDHPGVKSFSDFLYAVMVGNHKRITQVYKTGYDRSAFKDMSGNVGGSGGVLVPEEYVQQLLQVAAFESRIMQLTRRIPTTRESGTWPALDQYLTPTAGSGQTALAAGATLATVEAGGTYTEVTPQFTQLKWRLNKVGRFVDVENELIDDSPFAIETLLTSLFGIALANKNERNVIRGSGVGEPLGILNWQGAIGVTPDADNTFALADATEMLSRFKKFTNNVVWICHPSILPDIFAMQTSAGGQAFITDLGATPNGKLLGYEIVLSEHVDQANNDNPILADLGCYLWFEKQSGLAVAYSEHVNFKTDMGCWKFSHRNDGMPWLENYIVLADAQGSYTIAPFVYFND